MSECREHHFKQFGCRCFYCAIKMSYYAEAIAALNLWPKAEKEKEEWRKTRDSYKCKPHTHGEQKLPGSTIS